MPLAVSASSPKRRPRHGPRPLWRTAWARGASRTPGPGTRSLHRPRPRTRPRPPGPNRTPVRAGRSLAGPRRVTGLFGNERRRRWGPLTWILRRNACAVMRGCGVSRVLRFRGRGSGAPGCPDTNDLLSTLRGPRDRPGATPGQPRHARAMHQGSHAPPQRRARLRTAHRSQRSAARTARSAAQAAPQGPGEQTPARSGEGTPTLSGSPRDTGGHRTARVPTRQSLGSRQTRRRPRPALLTPTRPSRAPSRIRPRTNDVVTF